MTIKEFLRGYNASLKLKDKGEKYIQERIVNKYVPYVEKLATCKAVIDSTWYVTDDDGTKRLVINSPNTYLVFILSLIKAYTDIEVLRKGDNLAEQYDDLNKVGAVPRLINAIPKAEYEEFKSVLDMMQSDVEKNEYFIGSWLSTKWDSLTTILGSALVPFLKEAGVTPAQLAQIFNG